MIPTFSSTPGPGVGWGVLWRSVHPQTNHMTFWPHYPPTRLSFHDSMSPWYFYFDSIHPGIFCFLSTPDLRGLVVTRNMTSPLFYLPCDMTTNLLLSEMLTLWQWFLDTFMMFNLLWSKMWMFLLHHIWSHLKVCKMSCSEGVTRLSQHKNIRSA
jgi:hypothetical protein